MTQEELRALIAKEIVGSFQLYYRRHAMLLREGCFVECACIEAADAVMLGLQEWAVAHQAERLTPNPDTTRLSRLVDEYFTAEEMAEILASVPALLAEHPEHPCAQ